MKPFAVVMTYADQPTRAFGEQIDAEREVERLNRVFHGDRSRRALVPVYSEAQVRQLLHEQARAMSGR